MKFTLSKDKGVAGLTVLLSIIVMLFTIGFIIMIFTIMAGTLESEAKTDLEGTQVNESLGAVTEVPVSFARRSLENHVCIVDYVCNASTTGAVDGTIVSTNYTVQDCTINFTAITDLTYNNTLWNITYTYSGKQNSTASGVIRTTGSSLSNTVDWFGIIIVIGAMIVLILLTIIIITAIRGSGMIEGMGGRTGEMPIKSA